VDNLSRALDQSENATQTSFLDGIRMIHRQFLAMLERFGVHQIEALNRSFDPAQHEAMLQVETNDREPNVVVQELEKDTSSTTVSAPAKVRYPSRQKNVSLPCKRLGR